MKEVSGSELAALTGRSWRKVRSILEGAGIRPRREHNRAHLFDSEAALQAIYAPAEVEAYNDQRQRLAAAQAEKIERENAIRRGEVVDVLEVEKEWAAFTVACRSRLLGLPAKLGPRLATITDPAKVADEIRKEIREALDELSSYEPPSQDEEQG